MLYQSYEHGGKGDKKWESLHKIGAWNTKAKQQQSLEKQKAWLNTLGNVTACKNSKCAKTKNILNSS